MRLQAAAAAIALSAGALAAHAGIVTQTFNLFDHPGGLADPQAYGLRLDSFGGAAPTTFTFEDGGDSTVQLTVTDDGGGFEINISGVIRGNSAAGGDDFGTFMLDVTYQVTQVAEGWEDMDANAGSFVGGLTGLNTTGDSPLGDGEFFDLFAMSDGSDTFRFLSDGHRIPGDDDTWVGRGWLGPDGGGAGFNDLLFTAQIIPLPPAAFAGMGMLAGLGAYRRMRR